MQINKSDFTRQQAIRRVKHVDDRRLYRTRPRFSEPLQLATDTSRTYGQTHEWCPFIRQWMETKVGKQCIFNPKLCLRKAVEGILIEGRRIGKSIVAKKLVEPLERFHGLTTYEASQFSVRMFTRDSFLYTLINKALRENDSSKVETFGPYCYLLRAYIRLTGTDYSGTLYRGCHLSDAQIDQYRNASMTKDWKTWPSFTSTSKSQVVAQAFQHNVCFIFEVQYIKISLVRAFDIEKLSINPDEEEYFYPLASYFKFNRLKKVKTKTVTHVS